MDRQVKGILGAKLGMTQVWDNGKVVPVTVVQAGPCVVTQVRTPDKDGYSAVQLAYGAIDPRKVNKPESGHFAKADVAPRRFIVELRTTDASEYELGSEVTVEAFEPSRLTPQRSRSSSRGTCRPWWARTMPSDAAPHSTASIWMSVGVRTRLRRGSSGAGLSRSITSFIGPAPNPAGGPGPPRSGRRPHLSR